MKFNKKDPDSSIKIKKLIHYFFSKKKKNKTDKSFERAVKLENMIKIYKSELSDVKKINEMKKIYKSLEQFKTSFNDLEKYSDDEQISKLYNIISQISQFYKKMEENGIKYRSNELLELENEGYFEDYYYAFYFVNEYINFNASPYLRDFLDTFGIKEINFKRFLSIVLYLNEEVYDQYLDKAEENKKSRQFLTVKKVNNLYKGLTTGVTEDGERFDLVEFYKNVPFYDIETSKETLSDFDAPGSSTIDRKIRSLINVIKPEYSQEIMKYIYSNNLFGLLPKEMSEKEIRETNYFVNGIELSSEDKEIIIKYMKKYRIPFLLKAYNAVRDRYLKEGLEIEKGILLKK